MHLENMIKLVNGRGQLGKALNELIEKEKPEKDAIIYHTWNFLDKAEDVQIECYNKFKKFVDENLNSKIVFISSYSEKESFYQYYKQIAEAYLLSRVEKGYIVRLPILIGKGVFQKFRDDDTINAFGDMEVMTIKDAAKFVLDVSQNDTLVRSFRPFGTHIPAHVVKELIQFGKNGLEEEWKKE